MTAKIRIETALATHLSPDRLTVIDESHLHAGHHPQFNGRDGTHMRVRVVAAEFSGMTRLQRHRKIHDLLQPELDAGVHALAVEAFAPEEATPW